MKQILESGSPASLGIFDPSHGEPAWQTFVLGVSSCTQTATSGHTLDCLRRANSSDISQGLRVSIQGLLTSATNMTVTGLLTLPFRPTLDGPNGLIPDHPSKLLATGQIACVPFIAGTNLDEGEEIALFPSEVGTVSFLIYSSGTLFTLPSINSEDDVYDLIVTGSSPPIVAPSVLYDVAQNILRIYPDIPALGSPFGTGNETFGLSSVYKQTAAIR